MPGFVQCRACQIVHGGIDNGEVFVFTMLQIFHFSQEHAGIADQATTRFQQDAQATTRQAIQKRTQIVCYNRFGLTFVIVNTQATAQVDVVQMNAFALQGVDER